jgi:hypothetical protein
MRIGDVLCFSRNHKFSDLNFDDQGTYGWRFRRPRAGVIILAAIDFVVYTWSEEKPQVFLSTFLELTTPVASKVWVLFRDGLAHEGRVKPFRAVFVRDALYGLRARLGRNHKS